MEKQTLATLRNKYEILQNEHELQQKVAAKKLSNAAAKAKESANQIRKIMLGDDSRSGEAVIMSFFKSLYVDISLAYRAYMEHKAKNELDIIDKNLKENTEKLKTIKEFQEEVNRINQYNQLNIQKAAIEQKLQEEQLPPKEKESLLKQLKSVEDKIDKISDFYETTSDILKTDIEIAEEKWLGDSSSILKDLRNLSGDIKDRVLNDNVSLDDLIKNDTLTSNIADKFSAILAENDLYETLDKLKDVAEKATQMQTQDLN